MLSTTPSIHVYSWSHATAKPWSDAYVLLDSQVERIYQASQDVFVIATCHRTTFVTCQLSYTAVKDFMMSHAKVSEVQLDQSYGHYEGLQAWQYLIEVASGLDSMVLGEVEVMGQFRKALHAREPSMSQTIAWHIKHVIRYAKKIRFGSSLGEHQVSLASISITLAKKVFTQVNDVNVAIVGAGDLAGQIARALKRQGINNLSILSRQFSSAQKLADEVDGKPVDISQILSVLQDTDWLIVAVTSPLPIIGKGMIETVMKMRSNRLLLCFDLSMPCGLEPEVSSISGVYMRQLMDLEMVLKESWQQRGEQAQTARSLVVDAVDRLQKEWLIDQSSVVIQEMREWQSSQIKQILEPIEFADGRIKDQLQHKLLKISMHKPTLWLRRLIENKALDTLSHLSEES